MNELRAALELATDEELRQLTELLFRRRFNPLDYFQTPDPIDIQSHNRQHWLDAVEQRFRFLAADGLTVMRGQTEQVTYRQVLIQVCRHLRISYSQSLSTLDLEAEIFLNLLGQAWKRLPVSEQEDLISQVRQALAESKGAKPLPVSLQCDSLALLLKGGGALAVSSLLLRSAARRGVAVNAARYAASRSVLAFLGPLLWTWLVADLGWRAIATNYGRIIPTIFALAQIRLTRAECWDPA